MLLATRPTADEFAPSYARYIAAVPEGDLLATLAEEQRQVQGLLVGLTGAQERHRYGPDKWSVREVIGHCSDTERVFAYRALRIARADVTPLVGFDENAFVAASGFDGRPLRELLAEWEAVRGASLALLRSLDGDALDRRGVASGAPVSVRALAWMIAGHARHHRTILAERYLAGTIAT